MVSPMKWVLISVGLTSAAWACAVETTTTAVASIKRKRFIAPSLRFEELIPGRTFIADLGQPIANLKACPMPHGCADTKHLGDTAEPARSLQSNYFPQRGILSPSGHPQSNLPLPGG